MNVFKPVALDRYELCHPTDPEDFDTFVERIDGTPQRSGWRPIEVELIRRDEVGTLLASDSPWLGSHALIFRPRAAETIQAASNGQCELLPLNCATAELAVFN